jgi:hypothetical protein
MVGCWPSLPATIVSSSRICRDHNFRGFASVGLLDSNEAWVTLLHEKRTNADVTIGSHLRGGLLYSDLLICPTAAQHAHLLLSKCRCVHRVTASDPNLAIDPASSESPLNASLLLLNPQPLPSRRPGCHRLVPAVLNAMYFSSCRTTNASRCRLEYSRIHPRRLG